MPSTKNKVIKQLINLSCLVCDYKVESQRESIIYAGRMHGTKYGHTVKAEVEETIKHEFTLP